MSKIHRHKTNAMSPLQWKSTMDLKELAHEIKFPAIIHRQPPDICSLIATGNGCNTCHQADFKPGWFHGENLGWGNIAFDRNSLYDEAYFTSGVNSKHLIASRSTETTAMFRRSSRQTRKSQPPKSFHKIITTITIIVLKLREIKCRVVRHNSIQKSDWVTPSFKSSVLDLQWQRNSVTENQN